MHFKYPEILYGLLLLVIPILIHLFQLRRFQKEDFTNVAFLKQITLQTRKSSQLKKWLTLLTRLLLLAAIILAFAQPFTSKNNTYNVKHELAIYLDNSFSMQAKGANGELLKRAVQDLISNIDEDRVISIFTNNKTYKNVTVKNILNTLLRIDYTSISLDYNAIILKGKSLFIKGADTQKKLVLISDFQESNAFSPFKNDDPSLQIDFVQLQPVNTNNVSIDSVFVSKINPNNIKLIAKIKSQNQDATNLPISLFDDNKLIAKATPEDNNEAIFTLPTNKSINGKMTIEDTQLQFDNTLYFTINKPPKINVLTINSVSDRFLSKMYTEEEFNYSSVTLNTLNYNIISKQNLIVLNEIENLPLALTKTLHQFMDDGGLVLVIPSKKAILESYNQFFRHISSVLFKPYNSNSKKITTINYAHPIFEFVFEKQVTNFQYPEVNGYFPITKKATSILSFENNNAFLVNDNRLFVFASPLNIEGSNFTNSPIIVPVLYNIAKASLKTSHLYYTIGEDNSLDVVTVMKQDDILKLQSENEEIIPQQQTFNSKVSIYTKEVPNIASTYNIVNRNNIILQRISYNHNRKESLLKYINFDYFDHYVVSNSLPNFLRQIKSDENVNELWKWFIIFALSFLIIEILLLKYLK